MSKPTQFFFKFEGLIYLAISMDYEFVVGYFRHWFHGTVSIFHILNFEPSCREIEVKILPLSERVTLSHSSQA